MERFKKMENNWDKPQKPGNAKKGSKDIKGKFSIHYSLMLIYEK